MSYSHREEDIQMESNMKVLDGHLYHMDFFIHFASDILCIKASSNFHFISNIVVKHVVVMLQEIICSRYKDLNFLTSILSHWNSFTFDDKGL